LGDPKGLPLEELRIIRDELEAKVQNLIGVEGLERHRHNLERRTLSQLS
jgi:hypothetical protein